MSSPYDPGDLSKVPFPTHGRQSKPLRVVTPKEQRLDGVKVLLVEDAPDNQLLVSRILKLSGATVVVADNGQDAVNKALANGFDAVLMDLQMPIMDGFEATSELRRRGYQVPIVALTAHALKEERVRCLASGFDDHLVKPIDQGALVETLARYKKAESGEGKTLS